MSEKPNKGLVKFCVTCSTDTQSENKKRIFPKLCFGHVAMILAFIYIASSQFFHNITLFLLVE